MTLKKGITEKDGNFKTIARMQAAALVAESLVFVDGIPYKIKTTDLGDGVLLNNGNFANLVFNQVNIRFSKLDNPLCHLFKTNKLVEVSAPTSTDSDITWTRSTTATFTDRYGNEQIAAINTPREEKEGFLIEVASTNLFLNSPVGVTQSVAITNGSVYTVSFNEGVGIITLTGGGVGVVTSSTDITFTATSTSVILTVSGQADKVNLENLLFSTSHIITAGAAATRTADLPSIPLYNNFIFDDRGTDWTLVVTLSDIKIPELGNIALLAGSEGNKPQFETSSTGSIRFNTNATAIASLSGFVSAGESATIVMAYESGVLFFYKNGVFNSSQSGTIVLNTPVVTMLLGHDATSYANAVQKDLRFYDFALNQDEVTYLGGV